MAGNLSRGFKQAGSFESEDQTYFSDLVKNYWASRAQLSQAFWIWECDLRDTWHIEIQWLLKTEKQFSLLEVLWKRIIILILAFQLIARRTNTFKHFHSS